MSRRYLLDTNTVSYIVRGKSPTARRKLAGLTESEIGCISVITEAEIHHGIAKNPHAPALRLALEGFLAKIAILDWGRDEARTYGEFRAKLERAGKALGNMDMLIAAHAISADAILVTNDQAFSQVADLYTTVSWATDV